MHRVFQSNCCFDGISHRRRAIALDVTDEAKPTLMQGANETLVVAAVAERTPCGADSGSERRLRHHAALPNRVEQLVFADDSIAVANEVNKEVKHLRLDVNNAASTPQFLPCEIDLELGEAEAQKAPLVANTDYWSPPIVDLSNSPQLSGWLNHTIRAGWDHQSYDWTVIFTTTKFKSFSR